MGNKNRDRYINWVCEYDMMMKIQQSLSTGLCYCAISAVTGKKYPCKYEKDGQRSLIDCGKCIQDWLNKEV